MKRKKLIFTLGFLFVLIVALLTFLFTVVKSNNKTVFPKGILFLEQDGKVMQINIEIADREDLWSLGLMYRKDIPWEFGMLFVFPYDTNAGFWMKNTYVPLDIAFISHDGVIFNIQRMYPCKEGEICPVYYSPKPYRYALEVKAGFFERYGFGIGASIKFWKSKD